MIFTIFAQLKREIIDRKIDNAIKIWTLPIIAIIITGRIIGIAKIASKVALCEIILKLAHKQEINEIEIDEIVNNMTF